MTCSVFPRYVGEPPPCHRSLRLDPPDKLLVVHDGVLLLGPEPLAPPPHFAVAVGRLGLGAVDLAVLLDNFSDGCEADCLLYAAPDPFRRALRRGVPVEGLLADVDDARAALAARPPAGPAGSCRVVVGGLGVRPFDCVRPRCFAFGGGFFLIYTGLTCLSFLMASTPSSSMSL